MDALTAEERADLLAALLAQRPELEADVERLAVTRLADVDRDAVERSVVETFQAAPFTAIAERVGRRQGGYVEELEAASEVLEEVLVPFLARISRLGKAGFDDAAVDVGLGVMAALYRLRSEASQESLLGWAGPEDEAWELATSVVLAFDDAGVPPPKEAVDSLFPDWAGIA